MKIGITLLLCFLGCTADTQCTDDPNKGVCDTAKNMCVGKLHQSLDIVISDTDKNWSCLFLLLLVCLEDWQCTDNDKNVCDTTRNVCVGKFNEVTR